MKLLWWLRILLARWQAAPGHTYSLRMGQVLLIAWEWQGDFVWAAYSTPRIGGIGVTDIRHPTLGAAKRDAKRWLLGRNTSG